MSKATQAETELRIQTVVEMLYKQQPRQSIVRFASENWNVGERQVDNYISRATKCIKESRVIDHEFLSSNYRLALQDLYSKNYRIQDYRECRMLIELMGRMDGMFNNEVKQDTVVKVEYVNSPNVSVT